MAAGKLLLNTGVTDWSPYLLTPSLLKAWWNADDTSDGTPATWVDRITGLSLSVSSTPVSAATSFNSAYRGITFDGVDDCYTTTTLTSLPTGATPSEVIVAGSASLTTTTRTAVRYGAGAANDRNMSLAPAVTNRVRISDGTTNLTDTVTTFTLGIIIASWAGTTEESRINGAAGSPASATITTINTGTTRFRIGAGAAAGASSFWTGVLRHVLITTALTVSQRQQLEGWIAWDSGLTDSLPSSHPYKTKRP